MPIYEYRCKSCETVTEALVRNGNEPSACPDCGKESLQRLISRAGIIFKGSGFYVNDSRSGSSSASSNGSKNGESKSEAASNGTSSESKSSGDKAVSTSD